MWKYSATTLCQVYDTFISLSGYLSNPPASRLPATRVTTSAFILYVFHLRMKLTSELKKQKMMDTKKPLWWEKENKVNIFILFHNFEQNNFERNNFERNNFKRNNFKRNNFERYNFERYNFERYSFEIDNFKRNNFERYYFKRYYFKRYYFKRYYFERYYFERNNFERKYSETRL